ncbi:MAG TPA: hypothetical protein VGK49_00415, partial [Ilumatobacteraceae bacterium]
TVNVSGAASASLTGETLAVADAAQSRSVTRAMVSAVVVVGGIGNDSLSINNELGRPLSFVGGAHAAGGGDTLTNASGASATIALDLDVTTSATNPIRVTTVESVVGGSSTDTLVLPAAGSRVRFGCATAPCSGSGEVRDSGGGPLATFSSIEAVTGVSNGAPDSYVADKPTTIATLSMGAEDTFVVEVEAGAPGAPSTVDALTVTDAALAGTLEIRPTTGAPLELHGVDTTTTPATETPVPYLKSTNAATGSFATFLGLDLGNGDYIGLSRNDTASPKTRSVQDRALIRDIAAAFLSPADANRVYAFLSGELTGPITAAVELTVGGQTINGSATFSATDAVAGPVTITIANVNARLGDAANPLVTVTGASVSLTLTYATATDPADDFQLTGTFTGTVAATIPGATLTGDVSVAVDTAESSPVTATVTSGSLTVGGETFTADTLVISRSPVAGSAELRITGLAGKSVTLGAGGGLVTAQLNEFNDPEDSPDQGAYRPELTVSATGVRVRSVTSSGAVRPVSATVTVSAPGVGISCPAPPVPEPDDFVACEFAVSLDTTTAPGTFRVSATGARLTLGPSADPDHVFTADITIDQLPDAGGGVMVVLTISNLSASFGDGTDTLLSIANGAGSFVITSAGIAGSASATLAATVPGLSITAGTASLELNTTGDSVASTVTSGTSTTSIEALAGDFTRVRVTDAAAAVTVDDLGAITMTGDLLFEHTDGVTALGVSDLTVTVPGAGLFGAEGAFLVTADGVAGVISGRAAFEFAGVEVGGRLGVRVNSTGAIVDENTVEVGGRSFTIEFGAGEEDLLQIFGDVQTLRLGSFATIEGNFTFTVDVGDDNRFEAEIDPDTVIFIGEGPATVAGADNPAARGVKFVTKGAASTLVRYGNGSSATYALSVEGVLTLLGIAGVIGTTDSLSTDARFRFNTTGADESTATGDSGFTGNEIMEVGADDLSLTISGRLLSVESATIRRHTTSNGRDGLAAVLTNVSFSFDPDSDTGDTLVDVSGADGTILLTADGAAAVLSGAAEIDTGGSSTETFTGTIEINSTGAAVNERIGDVDLVLADGSYLAVTIQVAEADALQIGALAVSGGFRFVGGSSAVTITVTDGRFEFGELEVTGVNGTISWNGTAFTGNVIGDVSYDDNGVKVAGQLHVSFGATFAI